MTDTRTEHSRRQALSDHEALIDAQAGCLPCKLCGGKAVITDAGVGAGYYIACENSGAFRAYQGCMITERRLGGCAYNVMEWWNRLHSTPAPAKRTVDCTMCDDTGFKDHAWLRTEPCDHQRPARDEVRFDHARLTYAGMMAAMRAVAKTGVMEALDLAIFRGYVHGQDDERAKSDAMATADRLARRMGGRFVPNDDHTVDMPDMIRADPADEEPARRFTHGQRVSKTKGSKWTGRVVGFYSTALTPIGYAVESETETGSVQIYPEAALAAAQDQGEGRE